MIPESLKILNEEEQKGILIEFTNKRKSLKNESEKQKK